MCFCLEPENLNNKCASAYCVQESEVSVCVLKIVLSVLGCGGFCSFLSVIILTNCANFQRLHNSETPVPGQLPSKSEFVERVSPQISLVFHPV